MWDFQDDPTGGNTVTARTGAQSTTLTARGSKTVSKDSGDPGPFGPSLVLDGETVFVKDGDIAALDVSKTGGQVTLINWVNDTADDHDDPQNGKSANGMAFRAGSHCEGGPAEARQYGSYFDGFFYLGWSWGHYTPHIGAQDGPSPGYPWNRDYAASARKYFTGVGQGRWHMEAFTYDGHEIVAYVDGLSDMWKGVTEPAPMEPGYTLRQTVDRNPYVLDKPINGSPTTKRFSIGAALYGSPPFPGINFTKGKLGGVAVFDRALSAEEIMAVRLGTLLPGEPITRYSFEVTSPGGHPLKEIGWTAKSDPNCTDVSGDIGEGYRVSRPEGATKAFLRKASTQIGATWVPLTGLSSTQVKRIRFKLASKTPAAGEQRILVRVDGKWWASQLTYKTKTEQPDMPDWTKAETATHVMSWDKGQWRPATIDESDPGELSISDDTNADSIPAGPLQAIGFFSEGGDGSLVRLTDVELLP
ncbi:LamG domain-containing protein [Mycolicibacterium mucogenicum]|nr:LamG domain-containing protein [Mycolicibacterium mucogenicum]QPG69703.1 hypothetical protein C1S78_001275 [Mycolicibacterium mucogenicum DSM 44124]